MTLFQWLTSSVLTLAIICEGLLIWYGMTRRRISLMRTAVWLAAIIAILNPDLLQQVAIKLSIGRGADMLLYAMALAFPVTAFYFLHAIEKQRQQMTRLVRELAHLSPIHQPTRAKASPDDPTPP